MSCNIARDEKGGLPLSLGHLTFSSCRPFRSQMYHAFLQEAFPACLIGPLRQHTARGSLRALIGAGPPLPLCGSWPLSF